jgi:spermidine synthase
MKPLEKLGEARTPDGSLLQLYRHDGAYLIRADGVELMSTRRHHSEDKLAEVACAGLKSKPGVRVLIGGLGLGFTLREALRHVGPDAEVWVAELMADVIAWNANPEYDLSHEAMADPRVRVVHDDITRVLRAHPGKFDAIMLDTDNGPDGMILHENAKLYSGRGIVSTISALTPGGVIAYWSVAADDDFVSALEHCGLRVESITARAHVSSGPYHTIYKARVDDGRDVVPRAPRGGKKSAVNGKRRR